MDKLAVKNMAGQTIGWIHGEDILKLLMSAEASRAIHLYSDVDKTDNAQHHTLGTNIHQAKHG